MINHMTKWRKRIQKVPDTKSSPSTLIQKSCVFKFFHSRERILKVPFSRIFLCGYVRCSVDGRPNRNNKVAFSNLSGIVWTRPKRICLGKKYNISVKGKHTFLIVWIQVADTIYKQLTVKNVNSVWSGFFGVFWYRSIDQQVYLFFCYESKPFCDPNINFNVRLESLKSVLKIGEYPRIFPSFSWGIFAHVTRLDQSRASEII